MKRKQYFVVIVMVLLITVCGSSFIFRIYFVERRDAYVPINLNKVPYFVAEYNQAESQNANWLHNAREVAVHFLGANCIYTSIVSVPAERGKAVVIIVNEFKGCDGGDDSVAAVKVRVDLIQRGDIWEIEWAGSVWKCYRGRTDWGMVLIDHNPFLGFRWAEPLNNAISSVSRWLNPWRTKICS